MQDGYWGEGEVEMTHLLPILGQSKCQLTHVRGERGGLRGSLDGVHVVEFDEAVPGARGNQRPSLYQGTHGSIVAHQSTLVHEPVASGRQESK